MILRWHVTWTFYVRLLQEINCIFQLNYFFVNIFLRPLTSQGSGLSECVYWEHTHTSQWFSVWVSVLFWELQLYIWKMDLKISSDLVDDMLKWIKTEFIKMSLKRIAPLHMLINFFLSRQMCFPNHMHELRAKVSGNNTQVMSDLYKCLHTY